MFGALVRRKRNGDIGILVRDTRRDEDGAFFFLSNVSTRSYWPTDSHPQPRIREIVAKYPQYGFGWWFSPHETGQFEVVEMENT